VANDDYWIYGTHIHGPKGYTGHWISDGQIYGPRGYTECWIDAHDHIYSRTDGYICWISNNHIYGQKDKLPWVKE